MIFFYPALEAGPYSRRQPGLQHLAFHVASPEAVRAVYDKVCDLGVDIIHPPQEFPQYRPGYYAVFWRDPEGFLLEAVHRPNTP